jgi:hypothetical protein
VVGIIGGAKMEERVSEIGLSKGTIAQWLPSIAGVRLRARPTTLRFRCT